MWYNLRMFTGIIEELGKIRQITADKIQIECKKVLEDIHLESIPHVYFTKSMNRGSDCKCSNYLYNRDLKILEIYMRNYANPNYCESSLVYDGEYLRQGFHQDNIIY